MLCIISNILLDNELPPRTLLIIRTRNIREELKNIRARVNARKEEISIIVQLGQSLTVTFPRWVEG